jgi:hypothetical protein
MVFIPQRLLREKLALKEARATVDPKVARAIYFRGQAILEEATGETCWAERGNVFSFCAVAASLALASAYYAFTRYGLVAVAIVAIATSVAIAGERLLLRNLTLSIYFLLTVLAAVVAAVDAAWPKFWAGAALAYFLSFASASHMTFAMMMRNDRAYRTLYPALRIQFTNQT